LLEILDIYKNKIEMLLDNYFLVSDVMSSRV